MRKVITEENVKKCPPETRRGLRFMSFSDVLKHNGLQHVYNKNARKARKIVVIC